MPHLLSTKPAFDGEWNPNFGFRSSVKPFYQPSDRKEIAIRLSDGNQSLRQGMSGDRCIGEFSQPMNRL
jgi:hypothetical protein